MSAVKTELLKQKKQIFLACIVFPLLLNGLLCVDLQYRYHGYLLVHQSEYGLTNWQLIFKEQTIFYFSELSHIVAAAVVYEIFAVDLKNNGWLIAASAPYRKGRVLYGKFAKAALLAMLIFWAVDDISLFMIGTSIGVEGDFEFLLFLKSFLTQIFSSGMMIACYMGIICMFRRIAYILPAACAVTFLNITLYYTEERSLLVYYPFTYLSHAFRAENQEVFLCISLLAVITLLLFLAAWFLLKRNRDLGL